MLDILLQLTQYDGQLFLNDPPDSIRFQNLLEHKQISSISRIQTTLANSSSNSSLVTSNIDYLLIATDQEVTATLNGSVTPVTLTPITPGTKSFVFFNKGTVSSLTITNSSGTTAKLDIIKVNL